MDTEAADEAVSEESEQDGEMKGVVQEEDSYMEKATEDPEPLLSIMRLFRPPTRRMQRWQRVSCQIYQPNSVRIHGINAVVSINGYHFNLQ
jgi:hypothetical protein